MFLSLFASWYLCNAGARFNVHVPFFKNIVLGFYGERTPVTEVNGLGS